MYCSFDIIVRDAVNAVQVNVENLLRLATSAQEAKNYQEAYDYFTKALEYDADNYIAQFGKGLCAAKLSTPEKFRFEELKTGIVNGVNNAPADKKAELKAQAVKELDRVCHQTVNFRGLKKPLLQNKQIIESLEIMHSFEPQNVELLTKLIFSLSSGGKREKYLNDLQLIAPERALTVKEVFESAKRERANSVNRKLNFTSKLRKFKKYLKPIDENIGSISAVIVVVVIGLLCAYCESR